MNLLRKSSKKELQGLWTLAHQLVEALGKKQSIAQLISRFWMGERYPRIERRRLYIGFNSCLNTCRVSRIQISNLSQYFGVCSPSGASCLWVVAIGKHCHILLFPLPFGTYLPIYKKKRKEEKRIWKEDKQMEILLLYCFKSIGTTKTYKKEGAI